MKHEYSTQQIEEASRLASNGYTRIGVDYLLAFLDALPEPVTNEADEWEPCEYVDYRPGDRMMREGARATLVYKSPIRAVHEHHVELEDKKVHYFQTDITYYRIPAPVQHPDPEVHKYILVHKADPKYNRHIFPNVGMSNGISGYGVSKIHIPAEHILEWEELTPKVVDDDR